MRPLKLTAPDPFAPSNDRDFTRKNVALENRIKVIRRNLERLKIRARTNPRFFEKLGSD